MHYRILWDVYLPPHPSQALILPQQEEGEESGLGINWFQGNTSWPLAIRWLFFDYERRREGKQQYLVFGTSTPHKVGGVFTATWKFAHYQGGFVRRGRGRGPDCVPDVGFSFCLPDHSSASIFPLSSTAAAAPVQAEQRGKLRIKKKKSGQPPSFELFDDPHACEDQSCSNGRSSDLRFSKIRTNLEIHLEG